MGFKRTCMSLKVQELEGKKVIDLNSGASQSLALYVVDFLSG